MARPASGGWWCRQYHSEVKPTRRNADFFLFVAATNRKFYCLCLNFFKPTAQVLPGTHSWQAYRQLLTNSSPRSNGTIRARAAAPVSDRGPRPHTLRRLVGGLQPRRKSDTDRRHRPIGFEVSVSGSRSNVCPSRSANSNPNTAP
jgi:hypothetical protein